MVNSVIYTKHFVMFHTIFFLVLII